MAKMNQPGAVEPAGIDESLKPYLADPLIPRLLMRFWSTDRPLDLAADLAAPLRIHASEARKCLRVLVGGGLVAVRKEIDGRTTYSLTRDPSQRTRAERILHVAIERGGAR
jgi:hypothetical protein